MIKRIDLYTTGSKELDEHNTKAMIEMWNTAIEAAALSVETAALSVHISKGYPTQYSDTIRKLKK